MSQEVAWVGWEGSFYDWEMSSKIHEIIPADTTDDIINLREGRDFLEEDRTYSIVILCYICNMVTPNSDLRKGRLPPSGKWCISHLSTPENWRSRLLSTQAKTIVARGDGSEVGYFYLGDLPGYVSRVSPNFSRWDLG